MVRRTGSKLTLSGRTPMERVDVPKYIPKELWEYYSGAVVAHQSGYTLAGNFMLRVLIEQWVRSCDTGKREAVVDHLEHYLTLLPDDFKSQFPSLSDVYSKLSADIHSAIGSVETFEACRKDIDKHFDAIRLTEIKFERRSGV